MRVCWWWVCLLAGKMDFGEGVDVGGGGDTFFFWVALAEAATFIYDSVIVVNSFTRYCAE